MCGESESSSMNASESPAQFSLGLLMAYLGLIALAMVGGMFGLASGRGVEIWEMSIENRVGGALVGLILGIPPAAVLRQFLQSRLEEPWWAIGIAAAMAFVAPTLFLFVIAGMGSGS